MIDLKEKNAEGIKITFDMLYRMLNGAKCTHTEVIEKTQRILEISMPDIDSDAEKEAVVNEIVNMYETEIGIHIYAPDVLVKDKQTKYWLYKIKPEITHSYFNRYKNFLSNDGFSPKAIEDIEKSSEEVLSQCANPCNASGIDKKRGLVMGDVQSGKTANYLGLINMAFDYGYRIVVLLAGSTNSLRLQTQKRTDSGVIGAKSDTIGNEIEYIGVGFNTKDYFAVPFTNQANDFAKFIQKNLNVGIGAIKKPVVLVVKKVKSILESVGERLQSALEDKGLETKNILIIDDEADYASVNTAKPDREPTSINKCIRSIFNKFPIATYVGYTATPFANIFINPFDDDLENLDLFPSDFIVQLNAPSTYFGGRRVFPKNEKSLPHCLRLISEEEDNFLPVIHDRYAAYNGLADSLKEAIHAFLINCVIRNLRGQPNKHRTLMINITRFNDVQEKVREKVEEYIGLLKDSVEQLCYRSTEDFIKNQRHKAIFDLFDSDHYKDIREGNAELGYPAVSWNQIQEGLYGEITQIETVVINSKNGRMDKRDPSGKKKRFDYSDYEESGARVIAIGGMVLSRGLTLEGLMTSYYSRNAGTYDTLLQMCRWFGYRPKYEDLCRVYLTQESIDRFDAVLDAIEDLREQFREMERHGKTPHDFGLMIKESPDTLETTLLITARNKMKGTEVVPLHLNYGGVYADTSKLLKSPTENAHNLKAFEEFYGHTAFSLTNNRYMARDVSKFDVAELIKSLKIPYVNKKFDTEGLSEYIEKSEQFPYWDVVIATGNSEKCFMGIEGLGEVERSFHIKNSTDPYIRIGGTNNRVMEPSLFNAGLWLSKEKIQILLEEKNRETQKDPPYTDFSATDYLKRRQTPILLIYPIDLKTDASDSEITALAVNGNQKEVVKEKIEKQKQEIKEAFDNQPLLAFAFGFPAKESKVVVNYRLNAVKIKQLTDNLEVDDEDEGVDDADD